VRVRLPDRGPARASLLYDALLRHCRASETRPDVVQAIGWPPSRALPGLLRLRALGLPLVWAAAISAKTKGGPLRRRLRRAERRLTLDRFDAIVAPSAPLRDELRALGLRTRIEVIPHGVDLMRFRPASAEERRAARAAAGIAADAELVLCVGSVHPRKGTDLLLDAFATLAPARPALHVAIAGPRRDLEAPGLEDFRARLEAALARSGAAERVRFLGEIGDVETWLRAADVFVLPTAREGMPNAVLEAMASGLAVAIPAFAGISRDLGEPGEHYERIERDAGDLGRVLARLLDDAERRRRLGAAARAWLEETMDLGASLDRYAALYRELAG
jgi:glycosyltransferase involved in cell wall biosynthesis